MSRVKKITKTKAVIVWSALPLLAFGAITVVRNDHGWELAAWLCWVIIGLLAVNSRRIARKLHTPRRRSKNVKRAPRRKPPTIGDLGVIPWAGPAKQPKPIVIDGKQMDKWAADELAEIEARAEHKEITSSDGNKVKYSLYSDADYAAKREADGYR